LDLDPPFTKGRVFSKENGLSLGIKEKPLKEIPFILCI